MISIEAKDLSMPKLQGYLHGAVAPRPIAFASTLSKSGKPNLSPFSFFNLFNFNSPILVFSPLRKGSDNTAKHTLVNCEATREVIINVINYNIEQQMSLSSADYPEEEVNESLKSGLTTIPSNIVKPYRVGEKPLATLGIGVDAFPDFVKKSVVFNGNNFGKLGNINSLPTNEEIDIFVKQNFAVKGVLSSDDARKIHLKAK